MDNYKAEVHDNKCIGKKEYSSGRIEEVKLQAGYVDIVKDGETVAMLRIKNLEEEDFLDQLKVRDGKLVNYGEE